MVLLVREGIIIAFLHKKWGEEVKLYRPQLKIKLKFILNAKELIKDMALDSGQIWAKVVMAILKKDKRIHEIIHDKEYTAEKVDEFFERVS